MAGLLRTSLTFEVLVTHWPFSKTWDWNWEAMLECVLRGGGGTARAVLPTAKEGRRWSRYERFNRPVCHPQRIWRFELYSP